MPARGGHRKVETSGFAVLLGVGLARLRLVGRLALLLLLLRLGLVLLLLRLWSRLLVWVVGHGRIPGDAATLTASPFSCNEILRL